MMKLWIDDVRGPPSDEWIRAVSVDQAKMAISVYNVICASNPDETILISLDHDAGDYAKYGGDYIRFLDWLESEDIVTNNYIFHIHSMNPVGVQNMKSIIQHNNWRLI
jgi:hypothetical protein